MLRSPTRLRLARLQSDTNTLIYPSKRSQLFFTLRMFNMSEPKPINVTIANVISWYEESECCIFHNHAERIPVTKINDTDIVQSIIDKNYC